MASAEISAYYFIIT